jgi:hypothetical protein
MNLTRVFQRWELQPERDFGWNMKSIESAKTEFVIDKDGVFKLKIEHESICGVTPQMLFWWFNNLEGEMTYKGQKYPKYLVWHPKDHIHWSLAKRLHDKESADFHFRIVEAFDRNINFLVDSIELVEKLDETGIRLVRKIGNMEVFTLEHSFIPNGNDTIYKSEMMVGINKKPFGKFFNTLIKPLFFSEKMATAWLKHNIEEVGNFEFFLPELYSNEMNKDSR